MCSVQCTIVWLNLCHCYLKCRNLTLKWEYLIFQNFRETLKDTWYNKTFEEHGEIWKTKIHMWTVWLLTSSEALNMKKKKDKVQVPQRNEMLRLCCTGLGFISKMKTIIANKIYLTVSIWKTWYYRKLLSNRKESKCDDYSLLFSMCTDDDEHILTCGGLTAFRYWSREKEPLFVTIVITYSDKVLFNKRNKAIRFN